MFNLIFNRDEDLLVNNHPYGLVDLYFEKGEEVHIKNYSEYELGTDMWAITLIDGTEFFVMKESVEIEELPLTR